MPSATLRTAVAGLARQLPEEARVLVDAAETRHAAGEAAQRAALAWLQQVLGEVHS